MPNLETETEIETEGELPAKSQMLWQGLVRASILSATTHKLYRYISLADQKAMGLIIVNSAIIPFAMNGLDNHSDFKIPATLAIITGTISIMMAIICIFPKRRGGRKPIGQRNLLHFSEIAMLSEDEFMAEFNPVYNDRGALSQAVIKDIYDVSSRVLAPKFWLLKASYIVFFIGNLIAISTFLYHIWF